MRGFIFDRNTFDCFNPNGRIKKFREISDAIYKENPNLGGGRAKSLDKYSTFFDFNAPRYRKGGGPGQLDFLTGTKILQNMGYPLTPGQSLLVPSYDKDSTWNNGEGQLTWDFDYDYNTTTLLPQPFNPMDDKTTGRVGTLFSENWDDNYIQIVVWMKGNARKYIGTKSRKRSMGIFKISPFELYQGTADNITGLSRRFDWTGAPYIVWGGNDGSNPAFKVSNFSITINATAGVVDNFQDKDRDIVEAMRGPRFIQKPNFDLDFIDVSTQDEVNGAVSSPGSLNPFRKDFIPMAEVSIPSANLGKLNLQGYKTNDVEKQLCSVPNTVELGINASKVETTTFYQYQPPVYDDNNNLISGDEMMEVIQRAGDTVLKPSEPHTEDAPPYYMFCVVDWDDKDDKIKSVEDVLNDKPTNFLEILEAHDKNIYIFKDKGDILTNAYTTPGIKKIKVFMFSYNDGSSGFSPNYGGFQSSNFIEICRYKLMTVRIFLDIPVNKYPDFGDVGGDAYTTIPWPYTTPIVGGIDSGSKYKKSIINTLAEGNIGSEDIIDETFLEDDKRNQEMGKSILTLDLEQIRYFNTGSYDLNTLLGLAYKPEDVGQASYNTEDEHLQTLVGYYGGGLIDSDGDGVPDDPPMNIFELASFTWYPEQLPPYETPTLTQTDVDSWIWFGRPDIAFFIKEEYNIEDLSDEIAATNEGGGNFEEWEGQWGGYPGGTGFNPNNTNDYTVVPFCPDPEAENYCPYTQEGDPCNNWQDPYYFIKDYSICEYGTVTVSQADVIGFSYEAATVTGCGTLANMSFYINNQVPVLYDLVFGTAPPPPQGNWTPGPADFGVDYYNEDDTSHITSGCDLPDDTVFLYQVGERLGDYELLYNFGENQMQGFQFMIENNELVYMEGGAAGDAGFEFFFDDSLQGQYEQELEWDTNPYLNITTIDQFNETDSDVFTMLDKIVCTFDTSNPEFNSKTYRLELYHYYLGMNKGPEIILLAEENPSDTTITSKTLWNYLTPELGGILNGNWNPTLPNSEYKLKITELDSQGNEASHNNVALSDLSDMTFNITYDPEFDWASLLEEGGGWDPQFRHIDTFFNPLYTLVTSELPHPYDELVPSGSQNIMVPYWDGGSPTSSFSGETSVGQIFIDDNNSRQLKQSCKLELNTGNLVGKSIYDSSGNSNKGLLIGDYKIKKVRKGEPMRRDSFVKVPTKSNTEGAL